MKKKMYTYVFGYFSNSMCEKKKCIYVFFWVFPVAGNKEKKKKKRMKKKNLLKKCSRNGFGLLPNCIVKKKKLYCNHAIVLQKRGLGKKKLYCKRRV